MYANVCLYRGLPVQSSTRVFPCCPRNPLPRCHMSRSCRSEVGATNKNRAPRRFFCWTSMEATAKIALWPVGPYFRFWKYVSGNGKHPLPSIPLRVLHPCSVPKVAFAGKSTLPVPHVVNTPNSPFSQHTPPRFNPTVAFARSRISCRTQTLTNDYLMFTNPRGSVTRLSWASGARLPLNSYRMVEEMKAGSYYRCLCTLDSQVVATPFSGTKLRGETEL